MKNHEHSLLFLGLRNDVKATSLFNPELCSGQNVLEERGEGDVVGALAQPAVLCVLFNRRDDDDGAKRVEMDLKRPPPPSPMEEALRWS
jgi:hypothetical protein